MLGEVGADIIKVEPPNGNELRQRGPFPNDNPDLEASGLFMAVNLGKRGITLDVGIPTGKELFLELLKQTDVLVEDYPGQIIEEWQLDYAHLKQANPRLIVSSISIFGRSGPYANYQATHINAAAASGLAMGQGHPDREPLTMPYDLLAYQSGAGGFAATMLALLARDVTGRGQQVDVSEVDTIATLYSVGITTYLYRSLSFLRNGNHGSFLYPDVFLPCKDGYVGLVCNQLRQWIRFLELMGTPEWTEDPRYRNRRAMTEEYPDEVDALLTGWMRQHTREELFKMCTEQDVPLTPAYTIQELLEVPHLRERDFWLPIAHPRAGTFRFSGPPFKFSQTPPAIKSRAPMLGEHNSEVLGKNLDIPFEDLERLRTSGII